EVHIRIRTMYAKQTFKLCNRFGAIIDAKVYEPVFPRSACWLTAYHQEGSRLFTPDVATSRLRCFQYLDEPFGQRKFIVLQPGSLRRRDYRIVQHHVGLNGEALAAVVTSIGDTILPGMHGHPSLSIQSGDLSDIPSFIVLKELL